MIRRLSLPLALLTLFLDTNALGDTPTVPDAQELAQVLALGRMIDLNLLPSPQEKDLLVRLYEVPQFDDDCLVETHGPCRNAYYFSVSTYDEYPLTRVFRLNVLGNLSDIQWRKEDVPDQVAFSLRLGKYTAQALDNNPALRDQSVRLSVTLSARALNVESK